MGSLRDHLAEFCTRVLQLKRPELRAALVRWMTASIKTNRGKSKMWNVHGAAAAAAAAGLAPPAALGVNTTSDGYCSDGYLVNFSALLLRLAEPLYDLQCVQLLRVQPLYAKLKKTHLSAEETAAAAADATPRVQLASGCRECLALHEESTLLPFEAAALAAALERAGGRVSFESELFFLTHVALQQGPVALVEKFFRLNEQLHAAESRWNELRAQGIPANSYAGEQAEREMERLTALYLCIKTCLCTRTRPHLHLHSALWRLHVTEGHN